TLQNNPKIDQYWHNPGPCGLITRTALRTLQFTLAIIIAALYGIDLSHSTRTSTAAGSEWIYAEVVAALSAITCIVHCFATVTRVGWCTWDFVLFVLWMAQTGLFGNIYVKGHVQEEYRDATGSLERMRAGVWVGLVCMLLWLGTFVLGVGWCCRTRKVVRRTDK
ncbi:MARVEL domain-containing protein, partial [Aspergillus ruber CBS 135680]